MNSADAFLDFVQHAVKTEMDRRVEKILEEEIPKLREIIEKRVRGEVGQIATTVFRHTEFSRCGEEIRISVKLFEKP